MMINMKKSDLLVFLAKDKKYLYVNLKNSLISHEENTKEMNV
jgi:hypothetical protein